MFKKLIISILFFLIFFAAPSIAPADTLYGANLKESLFPNNLLTNLVAYWALDETSGARSDSHTNNLDLTDNNTVGSDTGKTYALAADFERGNSEFLDIADNAAFAAAEDEFTVTAWVNLESKAGINLGIVSTYHHDGVPPYGGFGLYYRNSDATDQFQFFVDDGAAVSIGPFSTTFGAASLATWYFVVGYYSESEGKMGISVNNGTFDTVTVSAGDHAYSNQGFSISVLNQFLNNHNMDGLIQSVTLHSRRLSDAEIKWLYNSGSGRTYAEFK